MPNVISVPMTGVVITALASALVASADVRLGGQSASATFSGMDFAVAGVTRATNVSLADCPPGANSVRGVIRPGDANEFASVTLDIKVQTKPATVPSPILRDDAGKEYKTAQTFVEFAAGSSFSCTFSYRVPKGTKLALLTIDSATLDLSKTAQ
jgi:hypothetical protein